MAVVAPDTSLEQYLMQHSVEARRGPGAELIVSCFFCGETRTGKRKLYINAETWLFDCKVCQTRGGKRALLEHFGDSFEHDADEHDPHLRGKVLEEYVTITEDCLVKNEAMLAKLFERGLSVESIEEARLGFVPKGRLIAESLPSALKEGGFRRVDLDDSGMTRKDGTDFHSGRITIPYFSGRHCVQIRGKDPLGKYFTPAGDQVRLYNADSLREAERAIVCEGEFDALILRQILRGSPDPRVNSIAVVGIPGVGALPGGKEGFPEYFRHLKRVWLLFDADDAGRLAAVTVKALLGQAARIVELLDEGLTDSRGDVVKLDVTEYLRPKNVDHPYGGHGWRDIQGLLTVADLLGKRVFSVEDAGIQWREDATAGSIPLGFPSLDALMGGGLRIGNLCIPLAKTGIGKSVFLANIAYLAQQAEIPSLLITLENTAAEVYDILRRIARFHGDPRMDEHRIAETMPTLRIVQENRLNPEDFALLVEEYRAELEVRPRLVMVDYLGYYARGRRGKDQYEKVSDATMQLKSEAKEHRCGIIAPHQVNRGAKDGHQINAEDARDSGVVEETADWMFGLSRPHEAIKMAGAVGAQLELGVLKGRRGGKGRIIKLGMSPLSLAIIDGHDKRKMMLVEQEVEEYNKGTRYEEHLAVMQGIKNRNEQLRIVG
jgi:replicative DNA helicase